MKLEFRMLVIDNQPNEVSAAFESLREHLADRGFTLQTTFAEDFSKTGLAKLIKQQGKEFDLVVVDYNLGNAARDGSAAAGEIRARLPYTDVIFYSSDPSTDLWQQLAKEKIAGVFVANRVEFGDYLTGVADTVIGKAVDLNHMRGIAMAEVADMDVMMHDVLQRVFRSDDQCFDKKGTRTLKRLQEAAEEAVERLGAVKSVSEVVDDNHIFSSAQKFRAIARVADCLDPKPTAALDVLNTFEAEIISKRNTLAHAKEDVDTDGRSQLRALQPNGNPLVIDDLWMRNYRTKLRSHRDALSDLCSALLAQLDEGRAKQPQ